MLEKENQEKRSNIIVGVAFALFVCIISYRLTNASLWFDETIEYWYSKTLSGMTPDHENSWNMYERIVSTYQPPLYNFVMFFWLKISESEWWMRFFGVFMGTIGAFGTFKTLKESSFSNKEAAVAIILYGLIYRQTYYWQEVAEYSLMLGLLPWCIYYLIKVVINPQRKSILLMTLFCILAVYSQYGAGFAIASILVLGIIRILVFKDRKTTLFTIRLYAASTIFTAAPLYFLFLKKQISNQGSTFAGFVSFDVKAFVFNSLSVLKYNLTEGLSKNGTIYLYIFCSILILFAFFYLFKGKKLFVKYLIIGNVICYCMYYCAVLLRIYAYGNFANKYNIFLIPFWFISGMILIDEGLSMFYSMKIPSQLEKLPYIANGIIIVVLVCWGWCNWTMLSNNWYKEDIRGATNAWYECQAYKSNTLVYYAGDGGFAYYLEQNNAYSEVDVNKIKYQVWDRAQTVEHYKEYINDIYGVNTWPNDLYIIASHTRDDYDTIVSAFTNEGYVTEEIFHADSVRLIHLTCPD